MSGSDSPRPAATTPAGAAAAGAASGPAQVLVGDLPAALVQGLELGQPRRDSGILDAFGVELLIDVGLQPDRSHPLDIAGPWTEADPVEHVDDRLVVRTSRNRRRGSRGCRVQRGRGGDYQECSGKTPARAASHCAHCRPRMLRPAAGDARLKESAAAARRKLRVRRATAVLTAPRLPLRTASATAGTILGCVGESRRVDGLPVPRPARQTVGIDEGTLRPNQTAI